MQTSQINSFRPLVLVAEDDESNFKLIQAIIGKKCDIKWARTGEEIIRLFEQHRDEAQMILMDIKMPVMDGLDATEIIRRESKDIPIVMQTAYAFNTDKEKALEAGANDMLIKPITLKVLRDMLSKYIPQLVW